MGKRYLAGVLSVLVVLGLMQLPWKLVVLGTETLFVKPGLLHTTDDQRQYWDAMSLEHRLWRLGWSVQYVKASRLGDYGSVSTEIHEIFINEDLAWSDRYHVLAHEAAHAFQPPGLDTKEAEAFAEAVSFLMAGGLRERARHLAQYKAVVPLMLIAYQHEIYQLAAFLE